MSAMLLDGAPLRLGRELGRGGEGLVCEVEGQPALVAKLYHAPLAPEKVRKLERMIAVRSDTLTGFTAWPTGLLRDPGGAARGFVMARVPAGCLEVHHLYSPRSRKANFKSADWRFLVRAAANIARAFAEIHAAGVVIGDVNQSGIMVSQQATVTLIDCDSFQIVHGDERFLCEVGVPLFTPPELQGQPLRGLVRTVHHDNFGLAVLIFHLLLLGRHPFAGRYLGAGDMPLERAISERRFAFGRNRRTLEMEPPPGSLPLDLLSPPVTALMEQAFGPSNDRPSAAAWIAALDALERSLVQCADDPAHYYPGPGGCPWCPLEVTVGVVLFEVLLPPGPPLDLAELRVRLAGICLPPDLTAPLRPDQMTGLTPTVRGPHSALRRRRLTQLLVGGLGGLLIVFAPDGILWWGASWVLFVLLGMVGRVEANELPQREREHLSATQAWRELREKIPLNARRAELEGLIDVLQGLPAERQARLTRLDVAREEQQRVRWLERHTVLGAQLSGIGSGLTAMLISFGIETAADVTAERVARIPGFGPQRTATVVGWRLAVERSFQFDPALGVDRQAIAAIERQLDIQRRRIESRLRSGPVGLESLRTSALAALEEHRAQANEAARRLALARLDAQLARGGLLERSLPAFGLSSLLLGPPAALAYLIAQHAESALSRPPEPPPAPPPVAAPASVTAEQVVVTRRCRLWGYDQTGQARVLREVAVGERFEWVARDSESTQVVDLQTGGRGWLANSCL